MGETSSQITVPESLTDDQLGLFADLLRGELLNEKMANNIILRRTQIFIMNKEREKTEIKRGPCPDDCAEIH